MIDVCAARGVTGFSRDDEGGDMMMLYGIYDILYMMMICDDVRGDTS